MIDNHHSRTAFESGKETRSGNSTDSSNRAQIIFRRDVISSGDPFTKCQHECHSTSLTSISTYSNWSLRSALRRVPKFRRFADNDPAFASTDYIFLFQRV